jgi:glycosyltransferase involved in cell wall biosynthesis
MKIVISIPAYNEESTLGQVLADIKRVMAETKYKYFIQIVDDGSTDRTVEVAESFGAKIFSHPKNYGLAEAFRTEMKLFLESQADVVIHTDADGQYPAGDIPRLLAEIEKGADLVLGSRFAGRIEQMPLMKKTGNKAFSKAISHITGLKITDGQTGFRAFTRRVAEMGTISTHTYTQEQIIRAVRNKFKVVEIPIYARKTRASRLMRSHPLVQPFEYAFKAWINIFRLYRDFEPLKFFGILGGIFVFAGLLLGGWLVGLFLMEGKIGHMPSTILTMLLILTGVQIWVVGFLADMFRKQF